MPPFTERDPCSQFQKLELSIQNQEVKKLKKTTDQNRSSTAECGTAYITQTHGRERSLDIDFHACVGGPATACEKKHFEVLVRLLFSQVELDAGPRGCTYSRGLLKLKEYKS